MEYLRLLCMGNCVSQILLKKKLYVGLMVSSDVSACVRVYYLLCCSCVQVVNGFVCKWLDYLLVSLLL